VLLVPWFDIYSSERDTDDIRTWSIVVKHTTPTFIRDNFKLRISNAFLQYCQNQRYFIIIYSFGDEIQLYFKRVSQIGSYVHTAAVFKFTHINFKYILCICMNISRFVQALLFLFFGAAAAACLTLCCQITVLILCIVNQLNTFRTSWNNADEYETFLTKQINE
jgi:hypothetical protein